MGFEINMPLLLTDFKKFNIDKIVIIMDNIAIHYKYS